MNEQMVVHTILYVSDQKASTNFYRELLALTPQLEVPGMTEFLLSEKHILGLMPESGIGGGVPDMYWMPTDIFWLFLPKFANPFSFALQ